MADFEAVDFSKNGETKILRKGCLFHFLKNVSEKIGKIYKINVGKTRKETFGGSCGIDEADKEALFLIDCIASLAYLPPALVRNGFDIINTFFKSKESKTFLEYFQKNYINGRYPIEMWNVYKMSDSTNNVSESYNSSLNGKLHRALKNNGFLRQIEECIIKGEELLEKREMTINCSKKQLLKQLNLAQLFQYDVANNREQIINYMSLVTQIREGRNLCEQCLFDDLFTSMKENRNFDNLFDGALKSVDLSNEDSSEIVVGRKRQGSSTVEEEAKRTIDNTGSGLTQSLRNSLYGEIPTINRVHWESSGTLVDSPKSDSSFDQVRMKLQNWTPNGVGPTEQEQMEEMDIEENEENTDENEMDESEVNRHESFIESYANRRNRLSQRINSFTNFFKID